MGRNGKRKSERRRKERRRKRKREIFSIEEVDQAYKTLGELFDSKLGQAEKEEIESLALVARIKTFAQKVAIKIGSGDPLYNPAGDENRGGRWRQEGRNC